MTSDSLLKGTVRVTLATTGVVWIGFWGYGASQGDMPPPSVIPGLILATILICAAVCSAYFVIAHTLAFLGAKSDGTLPPLTKRDKLAFWLGLTGIGLIALLGFARNPNDSLAVPVAIVGALLAIYGLLYSIMGFSSQYFRWYFKRSIDDQVNG